MNAWGPFGGPVGRIQRVKCWSGTDSAVDENIATEALETPFAYKVLPSPPSTLILILPTLRPSLWPHWVSGTVLDQTTSMEKRRERGSFIKGLWEEQRQTAGKRRWQRGEKKGTPVHFNILLVKSLGIFSLRGIKPLKQMGGNKS